MKEDFSSNLDSASGTAPSRLQCSSEQCKLLLHEEYKPLVKAIWQQPASATELAERLNLPLQKFYHRLRALETVGLVVSSDYKPPEGGRRVKRYHMSHDVYDLPLENTPAETLDELVLSQMRAAQDELGGLLLEYLVEESRQSQEPHRLQLQVVDGTMQLLMHFNEEEQHNANIIYWKWVDLDPAQVLDFNREFMELLERYKEQAEPHRRRPHRLSFQLVLKPN